MNDTLPIDRTVVAANAGYLEAHPLAVMFPMIEGPELEALKASIATCGIREPIVIYEGKILDGRNRYAAGRVAGYRFVASNFEEFKEGDPKAYVIDANVRRRHLSTAQKAEFVKRMIAEYPSMKDRQLAEMCGVGHMTVWKYRQPETDKAFEAFIAKWNTLTKEQRERFIREFASVYKLYTPPAPRTG
jgi:hypothetical protein